MSIASGSRYTARSPLETKRLAEAPERSMSNQPFRTRTFVKHMSTASLPTPNEMPESPPHESPNRLRHTTSYGSISKSGISRQNPRSRSIIRLQVPRNSPTMHRKPLDVESLQQQANVQPSSSSSSSYSATEASRDRASTFSCSRGVHDKPSRPTSFTSPVNQSALETQQSTPDEITSPMFADGNMRTPLTHVTMLQHASRRNSFLYQGDTEDAPAISSPKPASRSPSVSSANLYSDEGIVTPFAQILSTLYQVRSQFVTLTKVAVPNERRRNSNQGIPSLSSVSEDDYQSLALETLHRLDWCLHRLEGVNSAKSLGTMAQEKFQRMLVRELSLLSDNKRSGVSVSEWVKSFAPKDKNEEVDRALENVASAHLQPSDGMRQRTISVTEPVNRFGVIIPPDKEESLADFMSNHFHPWELNSFKLNECSDGRPLSVAAYAIFCDRGFFNEFKLSKTKFMNFIAAIESNYHPKNPYHTAVHATDVLHATNYLLKSNTLNGIFSSLEIMAALIAAAIHDVDHPGRNNSFLVNSCDKLAILYNDDSVLENHHLAVSFQLLQDPSRNFLENLEKTQVKALRKMIIDMVLATDMEKHFHQLGALKTKVETKKVVNDGYLMLEKYEERFEVLQCLIHCADLSNAAKPVPVAVEWAHRIMEEQFQQGDEERRQGLAVGKLGDRDTVCLEQCQITFIDLFLHPLWETWAELVFPDAQLMMQYLGKTREHWTRQAPRSPSPLEEEAFEAESGEMTPLVKSPDPLVDLLKED